MKICESHKRLEEMG